MEPISKQFKPKYKQQEIKTVFSPCQITKTIVLNITSIGKNLLNTLENTISRMDGGKCINEGYVKPGSIKVITFSSGIIKGDKVIFNVIYNCEVFCPVSGMNLNCIAKHISKAGIQAESADEQPSPFVLFIARDHYYNDERFKSIKENDKFVASVLAQRYELYEKQVSIIAELTKTKSNDNKIKTKPKLTFE